MSVISTTIPGELDTAVAQPAAHRPIAPDHRASLLHQLILDVHADVGDYCNLRDLLEAQFESALRHDTSRLVDIGHAMSELVTTLDTRRRTRLALVRQLRPGTAETPVTMLALFDTGPRQVVTEMWHTLDVLARECQRINTRNDRLLADQFASLQRVLTPAASPHTDPVPDWLDDGAACFQQLQCENARLVQYRENIDALTARLEREEARLGEIGADLLQARRLIGRSEAGSNATPDFGGISNALAALRDRLGRSSPSASTMPETGDDGCDERWVADGLLHRVAPATPDIAGAIGALVDAILLFDQPDRERDAVAWRVEIDRTLLDLDAGLDNLGACVASIVHARQQLQALSDNHGNLSLANRQLALSLGEPCRTGAAQLLQAHEFALQASHVAQLALAALPTFNAG